MYNRTSIIPEHAKINQKPSFPRTSNMGGLSTSNRVADPIPALRMNHTMPDSTADYEDPMAINRTGSGSLLFRRKRSVEEQNKISRSRAQEMSLIYELSDDREESLNQKGQFQKQNITLAPSLGSVRMTMKQALEANEKQQKVGTQQKPDALMTAHEREELEHNKATERMNIDVEKSVQHVDSSGPPLICNSWFSFGGGGDITKSRSWQRREKVRAAMDRLAMEKAMEKSISEGMEIIPTSPGNYSVAPTIPETPSPVAESHYCAGNGRFYDVPHMC